MRDVPVVRLAVLENPNDHSCKRPPLPIWNGSSLSSFPSVSPRTRVGFQNVPPPAAAMVLPNSSRVIAISMVGPGHSAPDFFSPDASV
jgi:hypothetical protein